MLANCIDPVSQTLLLTLLTKDPTSNRPELQAQDSHVQSNFY